jgi:hypothetical protein
MGYTDTHQVAAATYIRALLSGSTPNGTSSDTFGEYRDLIEVLLQAHAAGGTPAVHEAWNGIVRRYPELASLVSGDQPEHGKTHRAPKLTQVATYRQLRL